MSLFGQDSYYYWYKGEKIPLELRANKKFVLYENEYADSAVSFLEEKSWKIIKKDKSNVVNTLTPYRKDKGGKEHNWSIIEKNEGGNTDLSSSELPDYMLYVSPFFLSKNGEEAGLSHLFYVRLYKMEDINVLESFSSENNVEILGNNKFMPLWYTLACTKSSAGNALEMANLFYESGKFSAAEPDLMVDDLQQCVEDEYFSDQWNLDNTGQNGGTNGIDIQFCDARGITSGCNDIVVAVVDQGIEMNHPDLPNMFYLSYDTESGTQPSQVLGLHGTACAGIIGASTDSGDGIAGIAPN
jgi:subtilisin family serine protease